MFKTGFSFRPIAGLIVIAVMVMAGLASAHGRTQMLRVAVTKAAPCHEQAKSAKDPCKEICASGLPDHMLADAGPVVRARLLVVPVVYETAHVIPVSSVLLAVAWWHPPPGEGLPAFLRHQRLLI
jgi:hypothetical protein